MAKAIRVLLVDDDEDEYFLTQGLLSDRSYSTEGTETVGFHLDWVSSYAAALAEIERQAHDIYIVDYLLGEQNGLELVEAAVAQGCTAPILLMTGQGNYAVDLEAMRAGATDYLVKGEVTAALLERSIRYAIERKRSAEKIRRDAGRFELLATLSHTLAEAGLDTSDVLDTIVRQVAGLTGDACIIRLFSEDQRWLEPAAVYHPDPRRQAAAERLAASVELYAVMQAESSAPRMGIQEPSPQTTPGPSSIPTNGSRQTALLAPLRVKDRLIGALGMVRPPAGPAYTLEDQFFLQDLANRAALAIVNARLYEAESQRVGELDALHRATAALLSTIELDTLLSRILDIAENAIPAAERALLHLAVAGTGETQLLGTDGPPDPRINTIQFPSNSECSAAALRDKLPILIPDFRPLPDVWGSCFVHAGLRGDFQNAQTVMIAPLNLGEDLLGLLSLSSARPAAFDDADLRLLMSFANTTTAVLRNAMLHAKVQKLAITDSLTEVHNRRGLFNLGHREIDRALRFGRPLSAILVDMDNFKEINDTYGHAFGDQTLRIVADRLRTSIREVDILGRYGGDEFIVLLPETGAEAAGAAAERIRSHLAEPIAVKGALREAPDRQSPLSLTASLGVACWDGLQPQDLLSLLARADAAAYTAKQSGRNRIEIV